MVKAMVEVLMGAEADSVCGAPYRRTSSERTNQRNGCRERRWDTRVGTIDLEIPRPRGGSPSREARLPGERWPRHPLEIQRYPKASSAAGERCDLPVRHEAATRNEKTLLEPRPEQRPWGCPAMIL
jgi:hypothetical protein